MLNKNEIYTVDIIDQDDRGNGVGKFSGFPIFVRHAVIGDRLEALITKAKKTHAYAKIHKMLKSSPYRVEPQCAAQKRCGGCQLQNLSYEAQIAFKKRRVKECVRRIGGLDIEIEDVLASEMIFRYRNKAAYPVGKDRNGKTVCGFYAARTHEIIECDDCLLSPSEFGDIKGLVLEWMEENHIEPYDEASGRGLIRHIFIRKAFATGQTSLCLVINKERLPQKDELIEKVSGRVSSVTISVNKSKSNVIMGDGIRLLAGRPYIEDEIGDVKYRISPLSFYQINPKQTKRLYDTALEFAALTGKETVVDLYCGVGTLSLYMARYAKKAYGIEAVPAAVEDAKQNALLNGIENCEFIAGKTEQVLPDLLKNGLTNADVIILDPPRKGCDETTLISATALAPERMVYISCDPATLARDLKFLDERGYCVEAIQPVDMFPNTVHVETVVQLSKGRNRLKESACVVLAGGYGYVRIPERREI